MSTGFIPPNPVHEEAEELPAAPPLPQSVADTGLSEEFLIDLALKTLYVQGPRTGKQITDTIKLPFPFVDEQLLSMQQRRFVEVKSTQGASRAGYIFDLTQSGPRPRPRRPDRQHVRGCGAGPARAVPLLGRPAVDPAGPRDPARRRSGVRSAGAQPGDAGRGRSGDQLGPLDVPARRVGERQDQHRRDHRGHAGRQHLDARTRSRSTGRSSSSTIRCTTARRTTRPRPRRRTATISGCRTPITTCAG